MLTKKQLPLSKNESKNIDQKINEAFMEANLLLKNEKKKLIDELISIGSEIKKSDITIVRYLGNFANQLGDERTISLN